LVDDVQKFGGVWAIPKGATKPPDGRTREAKAAKSKLVDLPDVEMPGTVDNIEGE
jgi:hypothetical protein